MKKISIPIIIIITISLCIIYSYIGKTDYIEYKTIGDEDINNFTVYDKAIIEQEFFIPYSKFYGVGFYLVSENIEENINLSVTIIDKTDNRIILEKVINPKDNNETNEYRVRSNKGIKVDTSHKFSIVIKPDQSINSTIQLLATHKIEENHMLYYNNEIKPSCLLLNIYGGETKGFFMIFAIGFGIYIILLISYIVFLHKSNEDIRSNTIVQVGIIFLIFFLMMLPFSKIKSFVDEDDYIIGGMLMLDGKVLYKDYIVQHMPGLYIITMCFSALRATSITQFRIYFYILNAILYCIIYIRNKDKIGAKKLFICILTLIAFKQVYSKYTLMVIADNLQVICMLMLFLEFYSYLKDNIIDLKRIIIISMCIFFGVNMTFLCIYQIFAIFIGFCINEVIYLRKLKKVSFNIISNRYLKLIGICILPFLSLVIYFLVNDNFKEFYIQAYRFNREIYSNYNVYNSYPNFGRSIIQPFYTGVLNFICIIPTMILNIFRLDNVFLSLVKIIVVLYFVITEIKLIKLKKYLETVINMLFVWLCMSRTSEEFHAFLAWASMLIIVLINTNQLNVKLRLEKVYLKKCILNLSKSPILLLLILILSKYIFNYVQFTLIKDKIITKTCEEVISLTKEGEEIFYDINTTREEAVYFMYKNRKLGNSVPYIFPWFMDWYEEYLVEELIQKKPSIVVYDETIEDTVGVFGARITGYANFFQDKLNKNYDNLEDFRVWKLKDLSKK